MTKTIEVSDEVYESIKDQLGDFKEINSYEDMIGGKFFFRTVTLYTVGEVKKVVGRFVYLKNASWIPDTGRFADFLKSGEASEVEPVGEVFVNMDTVVDFFPFKHALPKTQK